MYVNRITCGFTMQTIVMMARNHLKLEIVIEKFYTNICDFYFSRVQSLHCKLSLEAVTGEVDGRLININANLTVSRLLEDGFFVHQLKFISTLCTSLSLVKRKEKTYRKT